MTEKVKGPASYFPSIEKKYGRPVAEWLELIRQSPLERHMELVTWLKTEYGLQSPSDDSNRRPLSMKPWRNRGVATGALLVTLPSWCFRCWSPARPSVARTTVVSCVTAARVRHGVAELPVRGRVQAFRVRR